MASFSDDFNRADSTDLGTNWVEVSGDWSIASNTLSPGSAGGTIILRAATAMATNDNYAEAKIVATAAVSQGVWCRGNANITEGYLLRNNGTTWDLFLVSGGSFTVIGTYTAVAAVNDVVRVQAVGSTIKGFVNGVERISVTNAVVTTGVNVGIRCESTASLKWDNFVSGDAVNSATLTPVTSSESALSIAGKKSASLGTAIETSSSNSITGSKYRALQSVLTGETAQNVVPSKKTSVSSVTEQNASGHLAGSKTSVLQPSSEQGISKSLFASRSASLGTAASNETVSGLTGSKSKILDPVSEVSTAKTIGREGGNMAQSILNSIKKVSGLNIDDDSFDIDVIMHINSVFSDLTQLGIGPDEGFEIEDDTTTWDAFVGVDKELNSVKTYIYLRLRLIFDPPATSYAIDSMHKQIEKLEWRLNVHREGLEWQEPVSS